MIVDHNHLNIHSEVEEEMYMLEITRVKYSKFLVGTSQVLIASSSIEDRKVREVKDNISIHLARRR